MKNEMLKNDIKEYHQDLQSNRSSMDDATMQLHMAKKRHANAAMSMKLTRKSYTSKENKNNGGSGGGGGAGEHAQPSWTLIILCWLIHLAFCLCLFASFSFLFKSSAFC